MPFVKLLGIFFLNTKNTSNSRGATENVVDGVNNGALKFAIKTRSDLLGVAKKKIFPSRWKKQKLVLLAQPNTPPGNSTSYHPICLRDITENDPESPQQ